MSVSNILRIKDKVGFRLPYLRIEGINWEDGTVLCSLLEADMKYVNKHARNIYLPLSLKRFTKGKLRLEYVAPYPKTASKHELTGIRGNYHSQNKSYAVRYHKDFKDNGKMLIYELQYSLGSNTEYGNKRRLLDCVKDVENYREEVSEHVKYRSDTMTIKVGQVLTTETFDGIVKEIYLKYSKDSTAKKVKNGINRYMVQNSYSIFVGYELFSGEYLIINQEHLCQKK